jgi:hypothetical protein
MLISHIHHGLLISSWTLIVQSAAKNNPCRSSILTNPPPYIDPYFFPFNPETPKEQSIETKKTLQKLNKSKDHREGVRKIYNQQNNCIFVPQKGTIRK